ncbi:MAG TPA: hypothetical protein VE684_09170, partial [Crenalkalicoccus sp.]|nr:hypothetical protein [Crenalkalicoccus sp.]
MMQRRALLGLSLAALLPAAAVAQTDAPPPDYPPAQPPPPARQQRAKGPKLTSLNYDEMTPRQRRKVAQRLAGPGNPPLPPEQARQAWDSMTPRQRRDAAHTGGHRRAQTGAPPPAPPVTQ